MHLTNEQLDLLCKTVGIAKQKLYDSLKYLDPQSDRARFANEEIDELTAVFTVLDGERDSRRKAVITS